MADAAMEYNEEKRLAELEGFILGAGNVARHYFFSRAGFTDGLLDLARDRA